MDKYPQAPMISVELMARFKELFPYSVWIQNGKLHYVEGKTFYTNIELAFFKDYLEYVKEHTLKYSPVKGVYFEENSKKGHNADIQPDTVASTTSSLAETEKKLQNLDRALFRINSGKYGKDKDISGLIHPFRLLVHPMATNKIDVKLKKKKA